MTDSGKGVKECPRGHGRLFYEDGEPYCLCCGWRPTITSPSATERKRGNSAQGKEPLEELEPMAKLYSLSTRRFHDYIYGKHPGVKVLGVAHTGCGGIITFNGKDISEVKEAIGPVSDVLERYIVPGGVTCGVGAEFVRGFLGVSGLVSGQIYQGKFFPYKNKPSQVELWAERGCSGVIVCLVPSPTT
jgi:hypothetical protein